MAARAPTGKVTDQLDAFLRLIQPSAASEARRAAVVGYVDELLRKQFRSRRVCGEPFPTGSFLSKTRAPASKSSAAEGRRFGLGISPLAGDLGCAEDGSHTP